MGDYHLKVKDNCCKERRGGLEVKYDCCDADGFGSMANDMYCDTGGGYFDSDSTVVIWVVVVVQRLKTRIVA